MIVRRVLVVAAVLAATTSLVPTSEPAEASNCADGVIVVIDASAFGAGTSQRCVSGAPGTGLDALQAAGHSYTFVPRFDGLVCTIDRRPDPCNGAPTDAYWSYWHADQGGSWTYSTRGAGNRNPQPGTVEGWRFGSGSAPGVAPPGGGPEPEPEPEPAPAEEPVEEPSSGSGSDGSGSGSEGSGSRGGSSSSGSSGSSGGSGASSSPGSDESSSSSSSTSPTTSEAEEVSEMDGDEPSTDASVEPAEPADEVPVDDTAGYRSPDGEPADPPEEGTVAEPQEEDDTVALPERGDDGVPVGLITGGGLIVGLAGLTAFQVRRRRLEG